MKERPILFTAPMVRAILEGRKTQTRRVMRRPPIEDSGWSGGLKISGKDIEITVSTFNECHGEMWDGDPPSPCPYGQPGDRLWVRETWRLGAWRDDGRIAIDYAASPEMTNTPWIRNAPDGKDWRFRAVEELLDRGIKHDGSGRWLWEAGKSPLRWRPSIHMPRWASRIHLEITDVRVERLRDISEADAQAEGFGACAPLIPFVQAWEKLYGNQDAYCYAANPWVWAISFKVVTA